MNRFKNILKGGDLRSIGQSNNVVALVNNQESFDELFLQLFDEDRKVVMRTADAIEKITLRHCRYLQSHKHDILQLCATAQNIELKWHLALLVARLSLSSDELRTSWQLLKRWATDPQESKIVRVNSLQSLFDFSLKEPKFTDDFDSILIQVQQENIPSINARIRKFRNPKR